MIDRVTSAGEMSDAALAQAFVARAPAALDEAYRRYRDLLYSAARSVCASAPEAEDCVHDALVRVWAHSNTYRGERGALRAFLVVCVRNEALTRRRDAARHVRIEAKAAILDIPQREAFEDVDHIELSRLRAALAALPAEQRTVLELAYFSGLSQSEIARSPAVASFESRTSAPAAAVAPSAIVFASSPQAARSAAARRCSSAWASRAETAAGATSTVPWWADAVSAAMAAAAAAATCFALR